MKTTTTQIDNNRFLRGVRMVWLLDWTVDQFGLATVEQNYATRAITIGAKSYTARIAADGIDVDPDVVNERGGLAEVGGFRIKLHDEDADSDNFDRYVLYNDEGVLQLVFDDGTQTLSDLLEMTRGVIAKERNTSRRWNLRFKDGSKTDLDKIPRAAIERTTFPYAYEDWQPQSVPFGSLQMGPLDGDGRTIALAKCIFTDKFALKCTPGLFCKTYGDIYQYYRRADRWAAVVTYSESNGIYTVDDPARQMYVRPARTHSSSTETDFAAAVDGSTSTGVELGNGDVLWLWLGGSEKLGEVSSLSIEINATGDFTYTIYKDATEKVAATPGTNDESAALTASDYADWDIALINIKIEGPGSGTCEIHDIFADLGFNDPMNFYDQAPEMAAKVEGWEDQAANYSDGSTIVGAGTALRNPVDQYQAVLRGSPLTGLETAKVNGTALSGIRSGRSDYKFDFVLDNQVDEEDWLDTFGFESGQIFFKKDGQWDSALLDETRDPVAFFHGHYHMPVIGAPDRAPADRDWDFEIEPVDLSDILNEIALKFARNPFTGAYPKAKIATGQYRFTGTGTIDEIAGTLTDNSTDFLVKAVQVGERIYPAGGIGYTVTTVAQHVLGITPINPALTVQGQTSVQYWLGPNLHPDCLLSQLAFKTTRALGTRIENPLSPAGYNSDLIYDDDTADLVLAHWVKWFSQPRRRATFPAYWTAVPLEIGDVVTLEHPKIPPSKRAKAITALNGGLSAGAGTATVTSNTAGLFRVGDWLFSWSTIARKPEAWKVTAVTPGSHQISIDRAQLETEAVQHASGQTIYRMEQKWLVVNRRLPVPSDPYLRLKCLQMPPSYYPTGRVVATGANNYQDETDEQIKHQSGYATLPNGKVVDEEADSNVSHVGPTTGQFPMA